ncbi:hypothetical protein [Gemmata sp.]|uniref:hypothetical protein n=1 Tax=Gemmata sp. TaxID=1914242 RepID=UPI003F6F6712
MTPSRKTRRDRGHDHRRPELPGDCTALRLLMRLWAGDTLDAVCGRLVLLRLGDPTDVFPIPTAALDELEYARRWVRAPEPGRPVALTAAGRAALAAWLRRVQPRARSVSNGRGDRIDLEAAPEQEVLG